MKLKVCNIKVEGNVEQPISQNFNINLKWLAIAIIALAVAGLVLCIWWSGSFDSNRYWLTESTGRIHKEGCMYYKKTKGYFVTGKKGHLLCRKCFGITGKERKK